MAETQDQKPTVLVFIAHYLPGFKAGGILRTMANTVALLYQEFNFMIVCQDRDLGDNAPYPGIIADQWQYRENAWIYYMSGEMRSLPAVRKLINDTNYDILYLNSLFDPVFTLRVVWMSRFGRLPERPLVLAPRGELDASGLKIKKYKKRLFISLAKLTGFYRKVFWHASTTDEARNIISKMHVAPGRVHIARDLPKTGQAGIASAELPETGAEADRLKLVFLSRISREKNLDYALRVLGSLSVSIQFDIYGPIEDEAYWKECLQLMAELPENVSAQYRHSVLPEEVSGIFAQYDLFFFPTTGESYGHVIAEALYAGTPVLISDQTPWKQVEQFEWGWQAPLAKPESFGILIGSYALTTISQRADRRKQIQSTLTQQLLDPGVIYDNRMLFLRHLGKTVH